jgi:hypothetical protein
MNGKKLTGAIKVSSAGIAALGFLMSVTVARADYLNLIQNGTFTQTTLTTSGQVTFNPAVTQVGDWWTGTGATLAFLYFPGTQGAQLPDQFSQYGANYFSIYPGVTNTIPAAPPGGGNFIAVDGDASLVNSFTQTVNGLTPGTQYALTFYQAAGQQAGYSGTTTEQWQVTFGTQTLFSAVMTDPSHDFVPWQQQTLTFTATNTSEYLTFMALGTPDGLPPIVMLADVSLVDPPPGGDPVSAPEPSTVGLFAVGLAGMVIAGARMRKRRL